MKEVKLVNINRSFFSFVDLHKSQKGETLKLIFKILVKNLFNNKIKPVINKNKTAIGVVIEIHKGKYK